MATKVLDANQTFMAQLLPLWRDTVLEQTKLPNNRSKQLRAAPLESPDLLGPELDDLTSTWSLEDEQAWTLGGKATHSSATCARNAGGRKSSLLLLRRRPKGSLLGTRLVLLRRKCKGPPSPHKA